MKPERNYLEVESTLTGEDVAMGIDLASMPHLMNVLTDLYENRVLACIREYSTNARDAMIEVGNGGEPIEVSLPGALRPLFTVKDRGPGLSAEDIRSIYSQYGASTKRGTNDAVGMLGLGCKSALTYTDQFTLVSVKDGTKTTVSISRDDAGAGVMKILAQDSTDEPNWTEIQIPARRSDDWQGEAAGFFRFWEPGTVLVDGQEPKPLDGIVLSDTLAVLSDEPNDWIVMGNVAYPTDLGIYGAGYHDRRHVVARVDIGAVNFTPSRESLMDTDRTKATQKRIKAEFGKAAAGAVRAAVEAAPDRASAITSYIDTNDALPQGYRVKIEDVTWQGEDMPYFPSVIWANQISRSGYKHGMTNGPPEVLQAATGVWITDYQNENWTGSQRNKLQAYMERHMPDVSSTGTPLLLTPNPSPPMKEWIDADRVLAWPDVRKWQPPPDPNAPASSKVKRVTGSYNGYGPPYSYVAEIPATDLPQDDTLFWVEARKYEAGGLHKRLVGLREGKATWLMLLPSTRIEKFKRDFPQARELKAYVKAELVRQAKAVKPAEARAVRAEGHQAVSHIEDLPPTKVDDPELRDAITLARASRKADTALYRACVRYDVAYPDADTKVLSVCHRRYPLLSAVSWNAKPDDLVLYANAAYHAAKQEGNDAPISPGR